MFYTVLGRVTWAVIKWFVRRKVSEATPSGPRPAVAALVLALGLIAAFAAYRHQSHTS